MRLSFLAAGVLASVIGTVSLALGVPDSSRMPSRSKLTQTFVSGNYCDSAGNCGQFGVSIFNDPATGGAQGLVDFQTYSQSGTLFTYIHCQGNAYQNVLTEVNMVTGTARVNAAINPASPDCISFNASAMTFSLVATKDGSYHSSNVGTTNSETPDGAYKGTSTSEEFAVKLTGSINGSPSSNYIGGLYDYRYSDRTKVR